MCFYHTLKRTFSKRNGADDMFQTRETTIANDLSPSWVMFHGTRHNDWHQLAFIHFYTAAPGHAVMQCLIHQGGIFDWSRQYNSLKMGLIIYSSWLSHFLPTAVVETSYHQLCRITPSCSSPGDWSIFFVFAASTNNYRSFGRILSQMIISWTACTSWKASLSMLSRASHNTRAFNCHAQE